MLEWISSFGFTTMVLPLVPFDASEDMEAITDSHYGSLINEYEVIERLV